MADLVSLLPGNASPRELAIEATSASRWPLPVDLVRAVSRHDTCPAELLGYLAWARGVDLWRDEWPIALKRHVAGRALLDQRLKGTLALHERYLGYVGAKLIRAITPPSRFVFGRRRTEPETEALLAAMPEIRIYRQAMPRVTRGRAVWGRFHWSRPTGWSSEAAAAVHETRAVLEKGGVAIGLRIAEITPAGADADLGLFSRLYFPHPWAGARVLGAGHCRHQRRWGGAGSTSWVVSFQAGPAAGRRTVSRGLAPAGTEPETIMARHAAPRAKAWHGRRTTRRCWWRRSTAEAHVYDRLRLWDAAIAGEATSRQRSWWSWSWRGQPTHSAVLAIGVAAKAPTRKRWWGGPLVGMLRQHDGRPLDAALDAIRAAAMPHETLFVDLETAFERRFYGA